MEAHDTATMREALEAMLDEYCDLCDVSNQMSESGHTCGWRNRWSGCQSKAIDKAIAVLSAPPTISEEYAKPTLCKTCARYTADGCEICGCTEYQEKEESDGSK